MIKTQQTIMKKQLSMNTTSNKLCRKDAIAVLKNAKPNEDQTLQIFEQMSTAMTRTDETIPSIRRRPFFNVWAPRCPPQKNTRTNHLDL